jgi:hypothetical protein
VHLNAEIYEVVNSAITIEMFIFFLLFFFSSSNILSVVCKLTSNSIGVLDNPALKLELGSTIPSLCTLMKQNLCWKLILLPLKP